MRKAMERNYYLIDRVLIMKRWKCGFIPMMMFLLVACGDPLKEKVIETYDNGQTMKVRMYDRKGECTREIEYYETGEVKMEGGMKGENREGEWKAYFPDGKIQSDGFFENGIRVGKATIYYENGNVYKEGYYKNGNLTGQWTTYDEQGYVIGVQDFGE